MNLGRQNLLLIVSAGLVLFLALGQRHSFGLYLVPVTMDWGWNRETFSIAIALQNLIWGLAQPFTGAIADRYGARPMMLVGGVAYAAGLALMPFSGTGLAFALTAGLLVGIGLSGTGFAIVYGAVGKSVAPGDRPVALALVGALGGLGQCLMLPFNQWSISGLGWSASLVAVSVVMLAAIPLALAVRRPPEAALSGAGTSIREALQRSFSDRDFWLITVGFLSCGFQLAFIATHLPAYLADRGMAVTVASVGLGLVALSNIVGTYLFGAWCARWQKKHLSFWLYLGRAVAILAFVLVPTSPWSVYLFSLAMGFLWLGTVPLVNALLTQLYGVRHLSMLFGFVFLSHQIGSFLGVWLGGRLFDAFQTYFWVWILAAALSVFSAVVHLPIRESPVGRPQAA